MNAAGTPLLLSIAMSRFSPFQVFVQSPLEIRFPSKSYANCSGVWGRMAVCFSVRTRDCVPCVMYAVTPKFVVENIAELLSVANSFQKYLLWRLAMAALLVSN